MPEFHLQRVESLLHVTYDGDTHTVPFSDVAVSEDTASLLYRDAVGYGAQLFAKLCNERLGQIFSSLQAGTRVVLVADDPSVSGIPWEYMRDHNGKLLSARLNLVRSIPLSERRDLSLSLDGPIELLGVPVSPLDDSQPLNTEEEWRRLTSIVRGAQPPRALTLKRVRPPTLSTLAQSLSNQGTSLIHFMGHSRIAHDRVVLLFEDQRGHAFSVDAADLSDHLTANVFLVVLNSCLSAVGSLTGASGKRTAETDRDASLEMKWPWGPADSRSKALVAGSREARENPSSLSPDDLVNAPLTQFGNIAQTLVRQGVPYALGMQLSVPDEAALLLSHSLYTYLFQGRPLEEAVRLTRSALLEQGSLARPALISGIPVLYTSLREAAPALTIQPGAPLIIPDAEKMRVSCDVSALPSANRVLGRVEEMTTALDFLLGAHQQRFLLLHGLGGIGKTTLARALSERVSWHYQDRVLAISFETFARPDESGTLQIDAQFAPGFYSRLAQFYGIDDLAQYTDTLSLPEATQPHLAPQRSLQEEILHRRKYNRSLLILDNVETIIDAQRQNHDQAHRLSTFLRRLHEGDGMVLFTSRETLPTDWGAYTTIEVRGLDDRSGAELFRQLLSDTRKLHASPSECLMLSKRIGGHPLCIRLLAGRFDVTPHVSFATFLQDIEAELFAAEQRTSTSLGDPQRHATILACIDYSVRRLTPDQRTVLDAISLFQAPFPDEFATTLLDDENIVLILQQLVHLGLLMMEPKTFADGTDLFYELHPTVRSYINQVLVEHDPILLERYGRMYKRIVNQGYEKYYQSAFYRYIGRQHLLDCEIALKLLPTRDQSVFAYHLARLYRFAGQNQRALQLYEQLLEISQELGDVRGVEVTQHAMGDVLVQQGKPQEALRLYEQSLQTKQEVGDVREVAVTQHAMAGVLRQQGKPEEALRLYEQSLQTMQALGDVRGVAVMQHAMAGVLVLQGKPEEALHLYEQSLRTDQAVGDVLGVAVTQKAMGDVLVQQGKPEEALRLYEQALQTMQALGDVRGVAVTQHAMAGVLVQQGKPEEALRLYEESLETAQELGDMREVAVTQQAMGDVLVQQGKPEEALRLYEESLQTAQALGDVRGVAVTQHAMGDVLVQQGKPEEALQLYEESLQTMQAVGDVLGVAVTQKAMGDVLVQQGKPEEALRLYEQALQTMQALGDVRGVAVMQHAMAGVLVLQGKPEEALHLYEQSLRTDQALGDVRGVAVTQHAMALVFFTLEQYEQALSLIWDAFQSVIRHKLSYEMQIIADMLATFKREFPNSPSFDTIWLQVIGEPQPEWLLHGDDEDHNSDDSHNQEIVEAVQAFINADNWSQKRDIVEQRQALLLTPESEAILSQALDHVKEQKDEAIVDLFETHLTVLQICRLKGIEATFAPLLEQLRVDDNDDGEDDHEFDVLIACSVAALRGGPQEKMECVQFLLSSSAQTDDADLQALYSVVQLALFGSDLYALGQDLRGRYKEVWDDIVRGVEDGA